MRTILCLQVKAQLVGVPPVEHFVPTLPPDEQVDWTLLPLPQVVFGVAPEEQIARTPIPLVHPLLGPGLVPVLQPTAALNPLFLQVPDPTLEPELHLAPVPTS